MADDARATKKQRGDATSGLTTFALRLAKQLFEGAGYHRGNDAGDDGGNRYGDDDDGNRSDDNDDGNRSGEDGSGTDDDDDDSGSGDNDGNFTDDDDVKGSGDNGNSSGDGGGKNIVFSPVSIYSALALVAAGARGETLKELLAVLGASSRNELAELACNVADGALADRPAGPRVAFAWGLWHEKTVVMKPAYRAVAAESYKAEIRAADFKGKAEAAREEINNWVSEATKELITSILPEGSVHPRTRLVLTNAIYFKGTWKEKFDKNCTKVRPFHRLDGSDVRVPFMSSRGHKMVDEYDEFSVLKLPYCQFANDEVQTKSDVDERPQFSMVIFLPHERDGLPSLVEEMASDPRFLWDHLPGRRVKVGKFRLPRFKLSFSSEISDVLKVMGMKKAFAPFEADLADMLEEDKAKLPNNMMDRSVDLYVETVMHKAVIEVNEEGTEAVASTVCSSRVLQSARRHPNFVADHPFVFFVVEEVSSTIVFMGHVVDPTKSEYIIYTYESNL